MTVKELIATLNRVNQQSKVKVYLDERHNQISFMTGPFELSAVVRTEADDDTTLIAVRRKDG